MDLQTVTRLSGSEGRISRLVALLCFGFACGLLVVTLGDPGRAGSSPPATKQFIAR